MSEEASAKAKEYLEKFSVVDVIEEARERREEPCFLCFWK
jgi:hypothetical protein